MDSRFTQDSRFEDLLHEATRGSLHIPQTTSLIDGRFVISQRLGEGGMGIVYEAIDTHYSTRVALKTMLHVDEKGTYRLQREFRSLIDVVHPNLVGLHELFSSDGLCFFTMDLIPGDTLSKWFSENPDVSLIKKTFLQLAQGIHAIHNAGKLHRDLKPSNVMVTPQGRTVILDFGLVIDQSKEKFSNVSGKSGTPSYMSPEQIRSGVTTPASDWYSFGLLLYEAITGKQASHIHTFSEGHVDSHLLDSDRQKYLSQPSSNPVNKFIFGLCEQLLQSDPSKRASYSEIVNKLEGSAGKIEINGIAQPEMTFVGRSDELFQLLDIYRQAQKRTPQIVNLRGVSGVGKSALVNFYLDQLDLSERSIVLSGRCFQQESIPFKTCDQLFDQLGHLTEGLPQDISPYMIPQNVSALVRMFPALSRFKAFQPISSKLPPGDLNEIRRLGTGAAIDLMASIAGNKVLVIFVDDLQWSDIDGASLLCKILKSVSKRLMFIGAYRSEEKDTSPGLTKLFAGLHDWDSASVTNIELKELNFIDSNELAFQLLPFNSKHLSKRVASESKGNPFFIHELARVALTNNPSLEGLQLDYSISERIGRLSDSEQELLKATCVAGRPIDVRSLVVILRGININTAIRALCASRLIRRCAGAIPKVAVYHDRIRVAVLDDLNSDQLKQIHKLLVRGIEAIPEADPISLVDHLIGAGEFEKAGATAIRAAKQAATNLAFEKAAKLYRLAIQYCPGDSDQLRKLRIGLADCLADDGHGADAAEAYMSAAKNAPMEQALMLRQQAAQQWFNVGHMIEGTKALNGVLNTVDLKMHRNVFGTILDILWNRFRVRNRGLAFEKSTPDRISASEYLRLQAVESATVGLWAADTFQSAAFSARYLLYGLQSGVPEVIVKGLGVESASQAVEGVKKKSVVHGLITLAEQLIFDIENQETIAFVKLTIGIALYSQGEVLKSLTYFHEAENLSLNECTRKTSTLEIARSFLGGIYPDTGHWRKLVRDWDVWIESAIEHGNLHFLTVCRTWPMVSCRWIAPDQPEVAKEHLKKGIEAWPWPDYDLQQMNASLSEILLELYNGHYDIALVQVEQVVKRMKRTSLRFVEMHRVVCQYYYAQVVLGAASQAKNATDKASLTKRALRLARNLKNEKSPVAPPFVKYIQAGIDCISGDLNSATTRMRESMAEFIKIGYKLNAAALQYHLGHIVGGDEGKDLIRLSTETMTEESIKRPDKVATMLAPGFNS